MGVFSAGVERFISWWEIPDDASRLRKLLWFLSRFLAPFVVITTIFILCARRWPMFEQTLLVITVIGGVVFKVWILLSVIAIAFCLTRGRCPEGSLAWDVWLLSRLLAPFAAITAIFALCARWSMVKWTLLVIIYIGGAAFLIGILLSVIAIVSSLVSRGSLRKNVLGIPIIVCFSLGGLAFSASLAFIIAAVGGWLPPHYVCSPQYLKEL